MTPAEITDSDIGNSAGSLRRRGECFAIATVIRTTGATAAKPGAKALVLKDGSIAEGWIGGGCVVAALRKATLDALSDGQPKLISLLPSDLLESQGLEPGTQRDGIRFARTNCPSNGSMDIFVEPVFPKPELVIFGRSPVARALKDQAVRFDWTLTHHSGPAPLVPINTASDRLVVIASQGVEDLECLRSALRCRDTAFIAFVGSRKKFSSLSRKLVDEGWPAHEVARIKAPAGLAIDAVTPDEIALSILAQLVQVRRSGHRGHAEPVGPNE